MCCEALIDPRYLAELIRDLDGANERSEYRAAFTCAAPSVEEPGRLRLWIVPRQVGAGANPSLWVRQNRRLLQNLITREVIHCSVVFPGALPSRIGHEHIEISTSKEQGTPSSTQRQSRPARKEIRTLSASTHLWVDRLRFHNARGDIDDGGRQKLISDLATKHWTPDKEEVYTRPKLEVVSGSSSRSGLARQLLLERSPTAPTGLTVLYGPGGIGKTFFLHYLAAKLGGQARQDTLASIPIFVHLPFLLHKQALEMWLSHHGFGRLTLDQIKILLRWGVVLPLLDALDEVVKGEAYYGSREFLEYMAELIQTSSHARGILACRDYYLNSDSMVPSIVRKWDSAELCFGFFGHQERRSFLQARTGLAPSHASKWTSVIEQEAVKILGEDSEEVEELIGNPAVLDILAKYISELPSERRVIAADDFKLSSTHIFGDIVDQVLQREHEKIAHAWREAFEGRLAPMWLDVTELARQRDVFQKLTLLVARDGAYMVEAKGSEDDSYRELRHGVFTFTKGAVVAGTRSEAFRELLRDIVGVPEAAEAVPEPDRITVQREALAHLADIYSGHFLANSEPDLPPDLVFAFRHRMFFEYFLADALLTQLDLALRTGQAEPFMDWCQIHHVYDRFASCLDFLLWDTRVVREGVDRMLTFMREAGESDDILASYLISLAFALYLRRGERAPVDGISFASFANWELLLVREMLPDSLFGFNIRACSFPRLVIDGIQINDAEVESCDFEALRIVSSEFCRCRMTDVECKQLRLGKIVKFYDCTLDLDVEEGNLILEAEASLELHNCSVSPSVSNALAEYASAGAKVTLDRISTLQPPPEPFVSLPRGRRFIDKLMKLLRRAGHAEFAVYEYKLRSRTPGTEMQFGKALDCLASHGCIEKRKAMIVMTPEGSQHMYQPKLTASPTYETHEEYWAPIVAMLDNILGD